MFEDGWVCRACWKPNRAQDDRCFRCKTPRDQQAQVEAGSQVAKIRPGAHLEGRLDAEIPVLAMLVAWPLRAYGALTVLIGLLIVGITLLSWAPRPPIMGINWQLFVVSAGMIVIILGALQIFFANSVRRHARWAYVVALMFGLLGSLPRLLNLVPSTQVPEGLGHTIWLIGPWLYLAMAIGAVVLLLTSFIRRDNPNRASASRSV